MPAKRKTTKSNSRSTGSRGLDTRLAALRADIEALQSDLRGLAGEVGEVAVEKATEAASRVLRSAEEVADNAVDQVSERFESAEAWTVDNLETMREQVRTQPLAAVLLSVSVGAVLGALLLRR